MVGTTMKIVSGIGGLIILVVIWLVIISVVGDIDTLDTNTSATQSILAANGTATTLSPIGEGITSTTATRLNRTWLEFDGVNDFINITDATFLGDLNLNTSVSFWVNITDVTNDSTIFSIKGAADETIAVTYNSTEVGIKNFLCVAFKSSTSHCSTINFIQNDWIHVVVVSNSTLHPVAIYVNGTDFLNGTQSTFSMVPEDALIGNATGSLVGKLDEIRIYNKTLTSAEVTLIFNSGRIPNNGLPTEGLQLWLPLNENSGLVANDLNNSDTGVISGSTWANDGEAVSLTLDTDFTRTGTSSFTIINGNYSYSGVTTGWQYNLKDSGVTSMEGNFSIGISNVAGKLPTIMVLVIVVLLVAVIGLLWAQARKTGLVGSSVGGNSL